MAYVGETIEHPLTGEELDTSGAFEARAKADLDPDWLDALRVRIRDLPGRPRPDRE